MFQLDCHIFKLKASVRNKPSQFETNVRRFVNIIRFKNIILCMILNFAILCICKVYKNFISTFTRFPSAEALEKVKVTYKTEFLIDVVLSHINELLESEEDQEIYQKIDQPLAEILEDCLDTQPNQDELGESVSAV